MLIAFVSFSQYKKIYTFYDSDSLLLKEEYSILETDASKKKHGPYRMISQDGILLKNGKYIDGERVRQWVSFNENGFVLRFGTYDPLFYQFTGCKFEFSQAQALISAYLAIDGKDLSKSILAQEEFINRMYNDLVLTDIDVDLLLSKRIHKIKEKIREYNSKFENDDKISLGNNILQSICYHMGWYPHYKEALQELISIDDYLINTSFDVEPEFYDTHMAILTEELEQLINSDSLFQVIKDGPLLITKLQRQIDLLTEFERLNAQITTRTSELEVDCIDDFSVICNEELATFSSYGKKLEEETELENMIEVRRTFNDTLILKGKVFLELDSINQSIIHESTLLESTYKLRYPRDYIKQRDILKIDSLAFTSSTNLDEMIHQGKNYLFNFVDLNKRYLFVDSLAIDIENKYTATKDNFSKYYPKVYRKEVKGIRKRIKAFNELNTIVKKTKVGLVLIDTLDYYSNIFNRFVALDNEFDEKFVPVVRKYKKEFREIYDTEIEPLNEKLTKYQKLKSSTKKLALGKFIGNQIDSLESYYSILASQSTFLLKRFPEIKNKYQIEFPPIYKETVKDIDDEFKNYQKSNSYREKLILGNKLKKEVEYLEVNYATIQPMDSTIRAKDTNVDNLYKKHFYEIFDNEIKDKKREIAAYFEEGKIENRISQGNEILTYLTNMENIHNELFSAYLSIYFDYDAYVRKYKEDYQFLYRTHIDSLIRLEKQYNLCGNHSDKIDIGNDLLNYIELYKHKYNLYQELDTQIQDRYDKFTTCYESKELKRILKKGIWLKENLKEKYNKEINFDKKEKIGRELISILDHFIMISSNDNTQLNEDMKEVKRSIDDIKRVIGYN
jgi:hypothetical protein